MNRTIAILRFHKIGVPSIAEWDTWFYIAEDIFAAQLEWLRTNHWHVIGMAEFLRGLSEPAHLFKALRHVTKDCSQSLDLALASQDGDREFD